MKNMRMFINPETNDKIYVETFAVWLFATCFGCFYFAFKGIWKHAIISFFVGVVTLGGSWIIYAFFAPGIVRNNLIKKGYIEDYQKPDPVLSI